MIKVGGRISLEKIFQFKKCRNIHYQKTQFASHLRNKERRQSIQQQLITGKAPLKKNQSVQMINQSKNKISKLIENGTKNQYQNSNKASNHQENNQGKNN